MLFRSRREQRETFGEREPRLRPEERIGSGAGPVGLEFALVEHQAHEVKILDHRECGPERIEFGAERKTSRIGEGGVSADYADFRR